MFFVRSLREGLYHFRDVLSPAVADRLAAERAREWRHLSERELVTSIARVLNSAVGVARYGAKQLQPGDPRLKPDLGLSAERSRQGTPPAEPAEPARAADGKFQQQAPPKRRPTSTF